VLNWVHIWTIGWPFHDVYTMFAKPQCHRFCCVYRGVILHENKTWLIDTKEVIVEYVEIGLGEVSMLLRLKVTL